MHMSSLRLSFLFVRLELYPVCLKPYYSSSSPVLAAGVVPSTLRLKGVKLAGITAGTAAILRVEDTRERCGEATASCAELTENCGRDNTCQGDNVTNDA